MRAAETQRITETAVARVTTTDCGEGAPFLLVHGYCGGQDDWREVATLLLAAKRRVITMDLPGHGESCLRRPVVTLRDIADAIKAVLVDLDLRRTFLAGHSLGSLGVLYLASDRDPSVKERVRAIGLVSATPSPWRPPELATLALGALPLSRPLLKVPPLGRAAVRVAAFAPNAADESVDAIRRTWSRPSYLTRWSYVAGAATHPLVARGLGSIDVPAVVVTGREDRLTPPDRAHELADALTGARLRVIADSGHAVLVEQPGAVAEALLEL